jgi:hypothetical protein
MAVGLLFLTVCLILAELSLCFEHSSLCQQLYQPPILPSEVSLQSLVQRHGMDYRTTFLEERRVRYDGVYISVCHYM